jgi:hypothetical protein
MPLLLRIGDREDLGEAGLVGSGDEALTPLIT